MDEQVQAVQKMQDYIKEHLCEHMSIDMLAKAAGYSPWYARRIFLQLVGISPSAYIRKLRLRESVFMLRDSDIKVVDAAADVGFESVDGFQRAFLREFGCNPTAYEKSPVPLPLYTPYGVKSKLAQRRTEAMSANHVFIQLIDKPKRKVIIKRGVTAKDYWTYCSEVGCDVWGILTSMKSLCGEPVCLWLPQEFIAPNTSKYVQGVEVALDYAGAVPEGFDVITLPAAKYIMFQGEPFAEEDFEQAIGDIWDAEKKYNPSVLGYEWDNGNPVIQLEPIGERGYIELMPVKAI